MNENNRQSMPILRKSCIFAVRIEKGTIQKQRRSKSTVKKKQFKDKKERSITNKKQNIYESNDYQRQRRPRSGES